MVFSIFGLFIDSINFSRSQTLEYNNHEFIQTEQGWLLDYNGKELYFFFTPQMVEEIQINKEAINKIQQAQTIQITYDGNSTNKQALAEIQYLLENILTNILSKNVEIGIFNNDATKTITCKDATEEKPTISLEEGNNEIIYENNCLKLKSNEDIEQLKQTEALIYQLLKIIK